MDSLIASAVEILREPNTVLPDKIRAGLQAIIDEPWQGLSYFGEQRPDAVSVVAWDTLRQEALADGLVSNPEVTLTLTWDDLMENATAGDLSQMQEFMGWGVSGFGTEPFYASTRMRKRRS